ncbi:MAG: protein kinase domain-containing protein [Terriglobia bacterium]
MDAEEGNSKHPVQGPDAQPTTTPAQELLGSGLDGGWKVISKVARTSNSTGGCFSISYVVENRDGRRAFLKALDYSKALNSPDPAQALNAMTQAYLFERDLLSRCRDRRMDRVVRALGSGAVRVDGAPAGGVVEYLIFELADGDVRTRLSIMQSVELAWILRCLHHMATGIWQLHSGGIAHQDLKPSNVLVFEGDQSKLADLGRASCNDGIGPFDGEECAGDRTYAPPELLYRYCDPDWSTRRFGCDAYLLGSMIVFFFTGLSATAMLMVELDASFHWTKWGGGFLQVLPYLTDAFGRVLKGFSSHIKDPRLGSELTLLVRQLCEPDPRLRGDPMNRMRSAAPFSMERYMTKLDLLARRAEIGIFGG